MDPADDKAPEQQAPDDTEGRAAAIPENPAAGSLTGQLIAGRYVIEGLLGTSATARTFRAIRKDDQRAVVIKLPLDVDRSRESLARRLAREADTLRSIDHPHIAVVLEQGHDDREGVFTCREFLLGDDLVKAARAGILTPRRICELTMQVLSALAEAHRHGILHRNLKPQNVLVYRDESGRETVRVCDFGGPAGAESGADYKAPEQGQPSQTVDGQADVYAVGVLLYELLAGEVPFRGATPAETMLAHANEPVTPPSSRRPEHPVPRELESVCLKALAKDPRDRHRSPREMSQALRAVIALLDTRADEPVGSSIFVEGGRTVPDTASNERMTVPGEQLRSHTKIGIGAALLIAVCAGILLLPTSERALEGERTFPPFVTGSAEQRARGAEALELGIARLQEGNAEGAVNDLRKARQALGDTPAVLRALGEALVMEGSSSEGVTLLERYLAHEPTAPDRKFVESLIRQGKQP